MPVIEYVLGEKVVREAIGEGEIEIAFSLISGHQLKSILIYDYEYRYFYIQKYLYEDVMEKFDLECCFCYHQKVIGLFHRELLKMRTAKRRMSMSHTNKFVFQIPYGTRSRYTDLIKQINNLIECGAECLMMLIGYNNPIDGSELFCVVETQENYDQVLAKIKERELPLIQEKTLETMNRDILQRKANGITLEPYSSIVEIKAALDFVCIFPEYETLKERGLNMEPHTRQPKIFISYSHKDREFVYSFEEELRRKGINTWIDKRDIDVGEHILEAMMQGIGESDLAVIFLSENYRKSVMCKLEIRTFFAKVIQGEKQWFLVKLDGVDLDEVYTGFGMYKYYEYENAEAFSDEFIDHPNKIH